MFGKSQIAQFAIYSTQLPKRNPYGQTSNMYDFSSLLIQAVKFDGS